MSAPPSQYGVLKRRLQDAGLFERQPRYYAAVIMGNLAALALCLIGFVLLRNPWLIAADAVLLGLVSGQLGFQLHDAGHRQVFAARWKNSALGLLSGNLLLGMSQGWWVDKHNRHHGNPNDLDLDPDVEVGALCYSQAQALETRGLQREVVKHQAIWLLPLASFLAYSMHLKTVQFLLLQRSRYRGMEVLLLAVHAALYVGFLLYFLGPVLAVMVIVIHKAVGGIYLASVFAPNHKGMLQTDEGTRLDFLRTQVLTARNVTPGWFVDFWYGSLNYQIEHHLFPGMPRNNYRHAHAIVRAYCAEVSVAYYETSMAQSYRELLGFLHEVGAPLRVKRAA